MAPIGGAPLLMVTDVAVVVGAAPPGSCVRLRMHRQQQQMMQTMHTTKTTTLPTVIEIAAVTPSDKNFPRMPSSAKYKGTTYFTMCYVSRFNLCLNFD